jgi:hypothetical protein
MYDIRELSDVRKHGSNILMDWRLETEEFVETRPRFLLSASRGETTAIWGKSYQWRIKIYLPPVHVY